MTDKAGIVKIQALLVALNEVGLELIKLSRDGVQFSDALALAEYIKANPQVAGSLLTVVTSAAELKAEVQDIDLQEGIQLGMIQASYVPKILEALKGGGEAPKAGV